ncbi:enoyl-CoA hydratase/isomerase family protein [Thalassotalea sp. HSM 43]|uniref:enoyl-CoA hydratase/isomerase family protein n=1 Tax=Thalassotalea sp. HSM 43 TaxID=2552945 RepID=UPI001E3B5405|nr:enoyl-CoA hydratase/isomerase family protein [Thalassotalea sp. HSM 43]
MVKLELTQINGHQIANIIIDRADKYNALSQAMWQQLYDYCQQLDNEIKPRVVLIKAAGEKAFCAGADINELTDIITDEQRMQDNNAIVQQAQMALQTLSAPTIALINGVCMGGGMGIALACDFRIAAEHAKFAITPSKLGLLYSIEDTRRVVNTLGMARAKELLYLGKTISAQTALEWGMLTAMVSVDDLLESAQQLAEQLTQVSGYSISGMKQTIAFVADDQHRQQQIRALFDGAFSGADFEEGAQAFLQKRAAKFR